MYLDVQNQVASDTFLNFLCQFRSLYNEIIYKQNQAFEFGKKFYSELDMTKFVNNYFIKDDQIFLRFYMKLLLFYIFFSYYFQSDLRTTQKLISYQFLRKIHFDLIYLKIFFYNPCQLELINRNIALKKL